ncbi:MAG TPA: succinate dehydrogenase, hydrophobic membrane anchor protein [Bauldia sp.]
MRTPLARVRHLGSAHGGTEHFWRQRLTGAANVPLVIAAVVIIVAAAARPYADVVAILHSPFVAAVFILLFVSASIHMRIGMQVIVEDYVSGEGLKVLLLGASTLFSITVAAVAILAVVKLAVGG